LDRRFLLCHELERRGTRRPGAQFVVFMWAYALDVAHGIPAGPYRDADARACLCQSCAVRRLGGTGSVRRE
jgi:hypothetical protein